MSLLLGCRTTIAVAISLNMTLLKRASERAGKRDKETETREREEEKKEEREGRARDREGESARVREKEKGPVSSH